jgi:cyclohexyl-isocyanide hydratase
VAPGGPDLKLTVTATIGLVGFAILFIVGYRIFARLIAAMAQSPGTPPNPMRMHGVLGAGGAGPGRPKIAMLVHPGMVMQDFIGPLTVFNLIHSEIHLVWKKPEPVMTEVGLPVMPSTPFADCPTSLDVLFVPGGLDGSMMMMEDQEVLEFLADRGKTARYVTSDCTGALVLGAAGLLRGYRATGHWYIRDLLSLLGATPVNERVVQDRNRITGGGVTAGIDFGLTLASLLRSAKKPSGFSW